jgi:hypothetical protein
MFGNYEVVRERNGRFSALLDADGMKPVNEKTEVEVVMRMAALDVAYENGVRQGVKEEAARLKGVLGL